VNFYVKNALVSNRATKCLSNYHWFVILLFVIGCKNDSSPNSDSVSTKKIDLRDYIVPNRSLIGANFYHELKVDSVYETTFEIVHELAYKSNYTEVINLTIHDTLGRIIKTREMRVSANESRMYGGENFYYTDSIQEKVKVGRSSSNLIYSVDKKPANELWYELANGFKREELYLFDTCYHQLKDIGRFKDVECVLMEGYFYMKEYEFIDDQFVLDGKYRFKIRREFVKEIGLISNTVSNLSRVMKTELKRISK